MTELADSLTRDHGIPFRAAHAIARGLVAGSAQAPERSLSSLVAEISKEQLGTALVYTDAALVEILSPRHFVRVRRTLGGPSPEEAGRAARAARAQLDEDRGWWTRATDALRAAERRLAERSAAL